MVSRIWEAAWDAAKKELVIWGEARERRAESPPSAHPGGISVDELNADLAPWELTGLPRTIELYLPTAGGVPLATPRLAPAADVNPADVDIRPWTTPAVALAPMDALFFLSTAPPAIPEGLRLDDSISFWREATKFLLDLLTRGRYLPNLLREGSRFHARWLPVLSGREDAHRLSILSECMPRICLAGFEPVRNTAVTPRSALEGFIFTGCDAIVRTFLRRLPFESGEDRSRSLGARLWFSSLLQSDDSVSAPLHELIRLEERLHAWARPLLSAVALEPLRVGFRLHVPPPSELGLPEEWGVELLLCAESDSDRNISAERLWKSELGFLSSSEYSQEDLENILLEDLGKALSIFPLAQRALTDAYPAGVRLSTAEAYDFLREAVPQLEALGYPVFLPVWWKKPSTKVGLKLNLESDDIALKSGSHDPFLATGQLLDFSWQVALGERELSREEFEDLVKQKLPLIRVQGQWVELDPRRAEATLAFLREQEQRKKMSFLEALHLGLGVEEQETLLPLVGLSARGWVGKLLASESSELELLEEPAGFLGELRPYQREGLSWLAFRLQLGIGGCLADDMGLGKTIQLLALLLFERRRAAEQGASVQPLLLIVPMSILANWEAEIRKFAPELRYYLHHGAQRWTHETFFEQVSKVDLVLTTYSLAFRDEDMLSLISWSGIALDEAQNIKNLETKQTRAVRRLCHTQLQMAKGVRPFYRLALTGTPLENHLQELWSIFDFLNPGLLGTIQEFRSRFAVPIERFRSKERAESLARLLKPFVLRRLKSDPRVISDLPEKLEMQELIPLTHEQAVLYQAALDEMLPQVEAARGMHRKGLVLATITRLKQICNHPALFLKDGGELSGRSHKIARLEQLLEEIIAEGDKALIFTQFAQFGALLQPHLQAKLQTEVLFLHGALARTARTRLVERFQEDDGPPIFILSLKAGGFGLNLTQANQVIHVDQWWNPAVEDQATDRAYRIGQRRNVQVRKLVCQGTLEERISEMLKQKRELADQIVGATRDSITQLSTDELRQLLELTPVSRQSAIFTDPEDL